MSKIKYLTQGDEFIIKNYNQAKPFSSFFPGIAGMWGKPMWVFYVNRGQAITCLGTRDKNGAIMEFLAANKAYRHTSFNGFRTFIKENDVFEPFIDHAENTNIEQTIHITSYRLMLDEINVPRGLKITVEYFTIPNENIPSLARILSIKNISNGMKRLECIDGMPMIIPYGTTDYLLKNMSRLAEGWFSGVQYSATGFPVYKLAVVPEDTPEIEEIEQANFYGAFYYSKDTVTLPDFIIDSDVVFGEMKDFASPVEFIRHSKFMNPKMLNSKNKTPSAFGYFDMTLNPDQEFSYYSIIGSAGHISDIDPFLTRIMKKTYLPDKREENKRIIKNLGNKIMTCSSSEEFNNYSEQTFIDNLLRGGFPVSIGEGKGKKNYYIYSRIHGDMEREYNNFVITPQYFSEGNGSYRDVNQNRRNDIFFHTELNDEAIIYFINLLQTDGFNPLTIVGSELLVKNKKEFLTVFKTGDHKKLSEFICQPFSLGDFYDYLEKNRIKSSLTKEKLLSRLLLHSDRIDNALPGVGFWSDHWHYNIDLLQSYNSIYPDRFKELFLDKRVFTFYDNPNTVLPRDQKHILYKGRPLQLHSVYCHTVKKEMIEKRKLDKNLVRKDFGQGQVYKTTLIAKLLSLIANKFASLDHEGTGIEMESDKPNWCDALNGLPGVFGSSSAESMELIRLIKFILRCLCQMIIDENYEIKMAEETVDLLYRLEKVTVKYFDDKYNFWNETHEAKEKYWKKTLFGLSGKDKALTKKRIRDILNLFLVKLNKGLDKAFDKRSGVINTYFKNHVTKYKIVKEKGKSKINHNGWPCIKVLEFKQKPLPLFLEGPVHYLRIEEDRVKSRQLHEKVIQSGLYDKKLAMLKVNASLQDEDISLGRIKIFTPGWLENESVWLHMEYKYLFELLRNNFSSEYFRIMKKALVPFMDPHVYGRSIFENVSFLASSAHPEDSIHGQGFVARLSGSTAEYISIWIAMTSGLSPFYLKGDKLFLKFKPQLASWMFTQENKKVIIYQKGLSEEIAVPKNTFCFKFLDKAVVLYHNPDRKDTFGNQAAVIRTIKLTYHNNKVIELKSDIIPLPYSQEIREGKVKRIDLILH
ncbi:MAG: hypothetical protein JW827_05435 [Spirochaetes bacterium]|nr:hypothetical protein [Spirochaetota bacterium]